MNTFLKRNRMIKLLSAGWIFAMMVIASVLLFGVPSAEYDGDIEMISGDSKLEMTVIRVPSSNSLVIVNSNSSMNETVLTLISDTVTFISIDGYDMSCAVIIAGELRESAEESTNVNNYVNDGFL